MFRLSLTKIVFVATLVFLTAKAGRSQTFYGSLLGTVTDKTGAAVPDAKVTLLNTGTQDARTMQTGATGGYQFVDLVPGVYQLTIDKPGFKRETRPNLRVEVQAALRADATLEVGEATQTVVVTTEASLLQTEQSSLSQAVEGRLVEAMPLNGRNIMNMAALVPGVVAQGGTSAQMDNPIGVTTNPTYWGNYQIGGSFGNENESYYDGVALSVDWTHIISLVPTQDAVQEFRVDTNNVSPEFGRFAGGVINMTSKSGTNGLHGTLYEYIRNKDFNANNFFNNRTGVARPEFTQNQYGAEVDGPIKKDKSFFMVSWEGFKLRSGTPTVTTVPTAAMRTGDFSASGIPTIYDPSTVCGVPGSSSGCPMVNGAPQYVRQPFPGNIIPANRIDPTAAVLSNFFGQPTQAGTLNNWVGNAPGGGDSYQVNTRVDQTINSAQRLFARFTYWNGSDIPADLFHNLTAGWKQKFDVVDTVLGYDWTVNPSTIADVRLSYHRFVFTWFPPSESAGLSLAQFGPAYAALQGVATFPEYPSITINGMQSLDQDITVLNYSNHIALSENVTHIKGRHTLKFGGESRRIDWAFTETNEPVGTYSFTSGFTQQNALVAPPATTPSGYAAASFLLGYPSSGTAQEVFLPRQLMWYHGLYFQDTFQATRKLTLNLGVRWDFPGEFNEIHNAASVFLPTTADPLGATVGLPNLMGPIASVASPLYPGRAIHTADWKAFQPRIGFAYRLDDKTVVSSGYGIMYLPNDLVFANAPWSTPTDIATTTLVSSTNGNVTPSAKLSNPFPGGVVVPPGHTLNQANLESTVLGSVPQAPIPNTPTAYMQQWNFTIQRQLPGTIALQVGYAGSKGTHLPIDSGVVVPDCNEIADSDLSLGSQLLTPMPNPFYNHVPTTAGILTSPTITEGQLMRPYPQYAGMDCAGDMRGDSSYNALQAKGQKRFQAGGTFLAAYTWSKLLSDADSLTPQGDGASAAIQDWNNLKLEKSLIYYDVPQHLVLSYVYDLPFGAGKKYGQNLSPVVNALVSGWEGSGTTNFQSGLPLPFTAQPTTLSSAFGGGTPRPNRIAGCNASISGSATSRLKEWFNTACFTQPTAFSFGNENRADPSLKNQGGDNWDVSLAKIMSIKERYKLRFESEFFNIVNRVQFSAPGIQVGNPTFGVVSAQRNQPRLIQFALRLTF